VIAATALNSHYLLTRTTTMEDISAFKQALSSSKNIIIVAGAGLSAASGGHRVLFPTLFSLIR
jgi:thiamine pyrophosphate-dependent acetolactate synthase large subunit-like protein